MNKGIRRSHRVGAFQGVGFSAECVIAAPMAPAEQDALLDPFIEEAIEGTGLLCGGGGRGAIRTFITTGPKGSGTEEERQSVDGWLDPIAGATSHEVGPLHSPCNGWD